MTAGNWRSTLGGACSAAGTTLMGIGVMSQFSGAHSGLIQDVTLVGFVLTAAGQFFGHLFAADSRQVNDLINEVQDVKETVVKNGNTGLITKPPQQK